jgi:hypothetical protein
MAQKPCPRINGKNKNVEKQNKCWDDEGAQACLHTKDSGTFLRIPDLCFNFFIK